LAEFPRDHPTKSTMAEATDTFSGETYEEALPENQMYLPESEIQDILHYSSQGRMGTQRGRVEQGAKRGVAVQSMANNAVDAGLMSNKEGIVGKKTLSEPKPLTVLAPALISLFNTSVGENATFADVVSVLQDIPNLDFDSNVFLNTALGIYYETSKRVQFRLGLFLNQDKEQILDCRRIKGDAFVMGNFFSILTQKMSTRPELGVKVVYQEADDVSEFFQGDDDAVEDAELGHLHLKNDPKLVKHLMKEIASSDLETQVNDTGLLAHAAELDANVETLASEGGSPLVELLGGKLQHNNAALVRQSAVLLKELTRMHPEIFTQKAAASMVKAMGKWAPKQELASKDQMELVSSKSTVKNLAEGISALMKAQTDIVKSITLPEDDVTCVINTLQGFPSQHENVMNWMNEMVC